MKKSYLLYFALAVLFAVIAIIGFVNDASPSASSIVAALLSVSMLLAGIHYRRKGGTRPNA